MFCIAHTGCVPRQSASDHFSDTTIGESKLATLTCTGSPCPWGESLSNHAVAWPVSAKPVATRLGYTASPAIYLPAASANGVTISIELGSASVYAGDPFAVPYALLATLSPGDSYQVSGLDEDEVLNVQSHDSFDYRVTLLDPLVPEAGVPADAGTALDAIETPDAGLPDGTVNASQIVRWTCTGSPCPWGTSLSGHALVWPANVETVRTRLGYTVSAGIYLPANRANGATISTVTGEASAYAGLPSDSSHRRLGTIKAGETLLVTGLASREVMSVQADSEFRYHATLPPPSGPAPVDEPGPVIESAQAFWRCNIPDCHGTDWTGAVITWPSWAAYQSNARTGEMSRSVFAADGTPLYPYMGAWAEGCEVTAKTGTVLIIEWQRGTNAWRATSLNPRQSHVIHLASPENGAMIESDEGSSGFSVSLRNCTPQPILP